jgi:HSP20 family molecular chaperone IbpA
VAIPNVAVIRTPSIVGELEQIRHRVSERAYELFRTSGSSNSPDENWLTAERELLWQPAVEMCQKDGQFEVRAALAGVDSKDVAITVTSEDLLIKGNGGHEHRPEQGTVHLCEFSRGQLFRPIHFPEPIDSQNVAAAYRNGLLIVTAPIAQSDPAKQTIKPKGRR